MAREREQGQNGDRQESFLLMRQTERDAVWLAKERGDINSTVARLYRALASHTDLNGECWRVGTTTLMIDIDAQSPETIRKGLRGLEDAKLEGTPLLKTDPPDDERTWNAFFLPWRAIANTVHLAWEARQAARGRGDNEEAIRAEQEASKELVKARRIAQAVTRRRREIAELHARRGREVAKRKREAAERKAAKLLDSD